MRAMRDPRPRARRLARLAQPSGLELVRAVRRFGAAHALPTTLRQQLHAYEQAQRYGLDLLPPMRLDDGLVVDVGANDGSFTQAVLTIDPRARVLAIEPAPETAAALARRFAGDPQVRVDTHAVSDRAGTATLNVTRNSVFSSLLEPGVTLERAYADAGTAVSERASVATARLDDLVRERVSVLKIDVQGAEAKLLRGAGETLARTRALLIEVTFVSHYEQDTTFAELHPLLLERGFVLHGLAPPYVERGQALWADACYVPATNVA
jgi:FkbM family methyltransferase